MDYNKPRAYRQGRIEAVKRRETTKKKKKHKLLTWVVPHSRPCYLSKGTIKWKQCHFNC